MGVVSIPVQAEQWVLYFRSPGRPEAGGWGAVEMGGTRLLLLCLTLCSTSKSILWVRVPRPPSSCHLPLGGPRGACSRSELTQCGHRAF